MRVQISGPHFAWLLAALLSVPNRVSRVVAITLAFCVSSAVLVVGNAREMVEQSGVLRGPGAVTARPEYYVFSRRPFAGREAMLLPVYRTPATYEAGVLETWKRQHVPIVLTEKATYPTFVAAYPALANHIATHYRPVADTQRDTHTITIHAERTRTPNGRDAESGWECFR